MSLKKFAVAFLLSFIILLLSFVSTFLFSSPMDCNRELVLFHFLLISIIPLIFSILLFFALKKFVNLSKESRSVLAIIVFCVPVVLNFIMPMPISCWYEPPNTPIDLAVSSVKSNINARGTPDFVDVTFSEGDFLIAKIIAEKSKLISSDFICVGISGNMVNIKKFLVDGVEISQSSMGKTVKYIGQVNQNVRLIVLCGKGNKLKENMDAYGYDDTYKIDVSECEKIDTLSNYCVVVVVNENN